MKQIQFVPIEERTTNDKLVNLYGSHLVELYTAIEPLFQNDDSVKPALPLLIELNQDDKDGSNAYESADIRVMVFGRETNNWNAKGNEKEEQRKMFPNGTYNFGLQATEDILDEIRGRHDVVGKNEIYGICDIYHGYCYEDEVTKNRFTKQMLKFMDMLNKRIGARKAEVIWNNLHKIGIGKDGKGGCCGQPTPEIQNITRTHFDVIAEEVKILKPDIVIFMTGWSVDNIIREKFNLPSTPFITIGDCVERLPQMDFPSVKYAARTIHPSAPGMSKEKWEEYCNTLIDDILKYV